MKKNAKEGTIKITKVVKMLSDNNSVPEKVKVKDIISFNKKKGTKALDSLILTCKELEQNLVSKADFIKARDSIVCPECGKKLTVKADLCRSCEKKKNDRIKEEEEKKKIAVQWENLTEELCAFNKDYRLVVNGSTIAGRTIHSIEINRIIPDMNARPGTPLTFSIRREELFHSGGIWGPKKFALRFTSNSFNEDLDSTRLKRDFGDKKVAKSLHEKIEKAILLFSEKREQEIKKTKTKITFIHTIIKDLKVKNDDIEEVSYKSRSNRYGYSKTSSTSKKVSFKSLTVFATFSTTEKTVSYSLKSVPNKQFTAKQIKDIEKVIAKIK